MNSRAYHCSVSDSAYSKMVKNIVKLFLARLIRWVTYKAACMCLVLAHNLLTPLFLKIFERFSRPILNRKIQAFA